jgi:hypothetical protein
LPPRTSSRSNVDDTVRAYASNVRELDDFRD